MKRSFLLALGAGICLTLIALPALASSKDDDRPALLSSQDVIYSGIDLWVTPADGRTHSDFADQPLPAGFFCEGSAPFSGKITFKGGGLDTVPVGAIGGADTIIERMDDAVFNSEGEASTRIRFLALSLTSIEPLQTACGQFQADIRLEGEQPVTSMQIQRRDANSGTFSSQLSVNARVTFTPLDVENAQPLSILQQVRFAPSQDAPWARQSGDLARPSANYARVDADGDGDAETVIPGPSHFRPGFIFHKGSLTASSRVQATAPPCHCDSKVSFDEDASKADYRKVCLHLHCPRVSG